MLRFFIDAHGLSYKAEEPRAPEDMERMNPSPDQLDALPDDGSGISLFDHAKEVRLINSTSDIADIEI